MAGWASGLAGWASGLAGWPRGGGGGQTNVRTENLPILQDYVPYRAPRCPKSNYATDQPTDRWTDGPTNRLTYRITCTRLKTTTYERIRYPNDSQVDLLSHNFPIRFHQRNNILFQDDIVWRRNIHPIYRPEIPNPWGEKSQSASCR